MSVTKEDELKLLDLGEMIYYTVQTSGGFVESVNIDGSYSVRGKLYSSVLTKNKEKAEDLCSYLNRNDKNIAKVRVVKTEIIE